MFPKLSQYAWGPNKIDLLDVIMVSEDFRKIGTNHYTAPKALSYIYIYSLDTDTPINHLDHHAHHSCTGLGSGRVGYKAK